MKAAPSKAEAPKTFKKDIIKPGDGKTKPKPGQTAVVHYTGKLTNGKVFDSSVARKEPFEFQVGAGEVIRCWDEGVAQMTLGEKAIITSGPSYAYGSSGAPPDIPPNYFCVF